MKRSSPWKRLLVSLLVWSIVLVVIFPLIWMILTSIKPQTELFRIPPSFWPGEITFEHYATLFKETPFPQYLRNSVIISASTTILVIVVAVAGAYSLTRFAYPGRDRLAILVLFTYLLPSVVLVLPLYLAMVKAGIANTLFEPGDRLHNLRAALCALAAALLYGERAPGARVGGPR